MRRPVHLYLSSLELQLTSPVPSSSDSARPASPFPAVPSPRPSSRLPVTSMATSTNEMDHLNLVDSVTAGGLGYGAGIDDLDTTAPSTSRPITKKRRVGGTAATSALATPAGASTGATASGAAAAGEDESSSEDGPARPSRRRKAHAIRPRAGYVSESSTTPPPTAAAAASGGLGAASGSGAASGGAAGAEGKVDIEDGVAYCYCAGPSYGEMIGCDSEECEREWVRPGDLFPARDNGFADLAPSCFHSSISSACSSPRRQRGHGTARLARRRRMTRRRPRRARAAGPRSAAVSSDVSSCPVSVDADVWFLCSFLFQSRAFRNVSLV